MYKLTTILSAMLLSGCSTHYVVRMPDIKNHTPEQVVVMNFKGVGGLTIYREKERIYPIEGRLGYLIYAVVSAGEYRIIANCSSSTNISYTNNKFSVNLDAEAGKYYYFSCPNLQLKMITMNHYEIDQDFYTTLKLPGEGLFDFNGQGKYSEPKKPPIKFENPSIYEK